MSLWKWVVLVLTIQLFYGFAVTSLFYALSKNPNFNINEVGLFQQQADSLDAKGIAQRIEGSTREQFNVSTLDFGALIFFSGNIFFDAILNSATAVPSMFTVLVEGIFQFFTGFPSDLKNQMKLFFAMVILLGYVASLLSLILQTRTVSRGLPV